MDSFAEDQHSFTSLLDEDFQLWCAGDEPPSEGDIVALEQRLGRSLPEQYRAFLGKYGGVMLEVREHIWPRQEPHDVKPYWMFQYAFLIFGIGADIPDWLDIEPVAAEFRSLYAECSELLPFFKQVLSADYFCFGPDGLVYEWSHEEPFDPRRVDEDFDQIVMRETKALVERKQEIK